MSPPAWLNRLARSRWGGLAASAALCGLYARGGPGWVLGFVALLPWLRTLDAETTLARTLLSAWAMSVGYTAAVFAWFGSALGAYTQLGAGAGIALLLLAAPLLQPQILAFALVRHVTARLHGRLVAAIAATAAWAATEWAWPHLLGDTLGHGLYPAPLLCQAAELGGATGLTVVLLLAHEALAAALARRAGGWRAAGPALALAAALPLALAGYGLAATHRAAPDTTATPVRLGLVQANITQYERRRREQGAEAVVREVLGTHFAMSYDAIEHRGADAVLWSETVYPTTFGQPKSDAGAALDDEVRATIDAAGVPFVFGTYARDAAGEYNVAALVEPGRGLVGRYRKTRLFPFSEALPAWLDTPALRAWLDASALQAGAWRPGDGARVLPLRLSGGREVPVLPLICLDDTDPSLALDGARLGAQLILTMSNDEWFTHHPQGAALHLAVAAFRSIETGLPQFRVTTNGFSAVIDARGRLLARSGMGERTLVVGEVTARDPAPTLMARWGDWVGRAAAVLLAALAAVALPTALRRGRPPAPVDAAVLPAEVSVLPAGARAVAGLLSALSFGGALAIAAAWLCGDGTLVGNTLALLRMFVALCVVPAAAAWLLLRSGRATLQVHDGALRLSRRGHDLELARGEVGSIAPWRLPLPATGATLHLAAGTRWPLGLVLRDPWALAAALDVPVRRLPGPLHAWAAARARQRPAVLAHPACRGLLLPLLLALPAFQLHQNIAYGSPLGEFYSHGLAAYLGAFGLWWAAWMAGVAACAAVLRLGMEAGALLVAGVAPDQALAARRMLERAGLLGLYLGLPAWLLLRATA